MKYVCVQAPAKVNLALRVGSARPDGFHPLDTVFEALNLYETLEAWEDPSGKLSLEFSLEGFGASLPVDESNLAIRAGLLLKERCGDAREGDGDSVEGEMRRFRGARMKILKRIPIAGGMAGGSADAAAALVALNELWELGLSLNDLMELGAELGSDVPFALMGGIAHGRGRGEKLVLIAEGVKDASSAADYSHGFVMLINPQGLSTPAVFREFDRLRDQQLSEQKLGDQQLRDQQLSEQKLGDQQELGERSGEAGQSESRGQTSPIEQSESRGLSASAIPPSTLELRRALKSALEASLESGSESGLEGGLGAARLDSVAAHMINDLEAPAFSLRPDLKEVVLQLRSEIEEGRLKAHGAILSGSGPTIALLCHPRHAQKIGDQMQAQYPELKVVTAYGPAPRASTTSKIS